ncbi:MAG: hypothetical protein ABIP49_09305 [Lysobacterales bacterium]
MPKLALITADVARARVEDLAPLLAACAASGLDADVVSWNTPGLDLAGYDAAVLRSPWDYAERLAEFLAWCGSCAAQTRLINPLHVVRWNIDKHYLADLAHAGIACVPSTFVEPGADARHGLLDFLAAHTGAAEFVVKPAVGAGSRDARRFAFAEIDTATAHAGALLGANRSVLLQPYLARVDTRGETALMYFDHVFSHAIRKGPLLPLGSAATDELFAPEAIAARVPTANERALGDAVVAAVGRRFPELAPLAYIRVDLLHDDHDKPCVLELELVEPSLFFAHGTGSAERFAALLAARLRT